ncbi:MAG: hypothetical protein JRN15_11540 [Nitrososphaerota archaeon]|nr:hypothetical protein [Nitrososphaerota archaeon]
MKQNTNQRFGILLIGTTLVLAGVLAGATFIQGQSSRMPSNNLADMPMIPVQSLGNVSTLSQARIAIGVDFSIPTYLPQGMQLESIRVMENTVTLVFYDRNISFPKIPFYDNASLIIAILRDNSSYPGASTPPPSPSVSVSENGVVTSENVQVFTQKVSATPVTVSGHPGWGINPPTNIIQSNGFGFQNAGMLQWWSTVHYVIIADIPFQQLLPVAESMNT